MVPTEVLAEQHYKNLLKYLNPLLVSVELLTGNTPQKKRKEIFSNLNNGLVDILVGTHALFEDKVIFNALGISGGGALGAVGKAILGSICAPRHSALGP